MLRSMHGVAPLKLDLHLSRQALSRSMSDVSGYKPTSEPGMNVFDICQGSMTGSGVTKEW